MYLVRRCIRWAKPEYARRQRPGARHRRSRRHVQVNPVGGIAHCVRLFGRYSESPPRLSESATLEPVTRDGFRSGAADNWQVHRAGYSNDGECRNARVWHRK
jgi:hypothetical protein